MPHAGNKELPPEEDLFFLYSKHLFQGFLYLSRVPVHIMQQHPLPLPQAFFFLKHKYGGEFWQQKNGDRKCSYGQGSAHKTHTSFSHPTKKHHLMVLFEKGTWGKLLSFGKLWMQGRYLRGSNTPQWLYPHY